MTSITTAAAVDSPPAADEEVSGKGGTALLCRQSAAGAAESLARLTAAGWRCVIADDVERAQWLASVRHFRLVVLVGGGTWSRDTVMAVRPLTAAPVLLLTPDLAEAQADLLRLGADLVLDGACDAALLRAAVQALLRRSAGGPALRYLEAQGLRLDLSARRASLNDRDLTLTPTEFDVLRLLMVQAQIAVKHHEIIKAVWNWKYTADRNALRLQINRLRSKLTVAEGSPFIRSVRGVGYVFDKPVVEFADDREPNEAVRESTNLMLEGRLRSLIKSLTEAENRDVACQALVDAVVDEGLCDGAAVFAPRTRRDVLDLVAHSGMSTSWQLAVAGGLPLTERFLAADTFTSQEVRNVVDICKLNRRYGATVRLMGTAVPLPVQLPARLSVPLVDRHGGWGLVGFGRRRDNPYTTAQCMVLEAAAAVLGALFPEPVTAAAAGW